jgi:hypothetical protein
MENKLKGGKADGMTIEDIAKRHKMDVELLKVQLENGIKIEREHTKDESLAREIAMDHLFETPDYYIKLKKVEPKEQIMSDSSGSFEGPLSTTILKRDIFEKGFKLSNFKPKEQEVKEITGAGVSAGAMYDAPIGHGNKDPLKIDNAESKKTGTITASKEGRAFKDKNFPKFGGPGGKFVDVKKECTLGGLGNKSKACNQGDQGNLIFYENKEFQEAIQEASKKYGISIKEVKKIVTEALPSNIDFGPASTWNKKNKELTKFLYHLVTIDPETKQPTPLEFETKDEIEFARLKLMLHSNGTKFYEEKHPIEDESDMEISNISKDVESDDDSDFAGDNDIFANMK